LAEFNIAESTGIGSLPYESDPISIGNILSSILEQNIQLPDWANPRELLGPDKLERERTILDLFVSPEGKVAPLDFAFGAGTGMKLASKPLQKGLTHLIRKFINPKFNTAQVTRGTMKYPEFTLTDSEGKAVMKSLSPDFKDSGTFASLNPYKSLSYARDKGYMHTFDVPIEKLPHNIPGGGVAETQVFKEGIPIEYSRNILKGKDFRSLLEEIDIGKSVGELSDEVTALLHSLKKRRSIYPELLGGYTGIKLGQATTNK
jgi:hypothetical protein